jgi:nucleoid DNA-binding protein
MTRADLIALIARRVGCTKAQAARLIDNIFQEMGAQLLAGVPCRLPGIGTLRVVTSRPRPNLFGASTKRSGRVRLVIRPATHFRLRLGPKPPAALDMSPADTPEDVTHERA